jgi:membrane protein implicated in regulation of membrane protease activity
VKLNINTFKKLAVAMIIFLPTSLIAVVLMFSLNVFWLGVGGAVFDILISSWKWILKMSLLTSVIGSVVTVVYQDDLYNGVRPESSKNNKIH